MNRHRPPGHPPRPVTRFGPPGRSGPPSRRGAFIVVAAACLVVTIAFAALSIDLGWIAFTQSSQQNAVDAAALAGAQEISRVIRDAGRDGVTNVAAAVESGAKAMAVHVAELNGVYVDSSRDVELGNRYYDAGNGIFRVRWGVGPYNAVRVTARRDNGDSTAPDAALPLFFAPFFGSNTQNVVTKAVAYVEARDIVLTLDYTGSMNDDSTFKGISTLGQSAVESNMLQIYNQLGLNVPGLPTTSDYITLRGQAIGGPAIDVTFKGNNVLVKTSSGSLQTVKLTFVTGDTQSWNTSGNNKTFTGTSDRARRYVTRAEVKASNKTVVIDYNMNNLKAELGLSLLPYPYPGGSWDEFINNHAYTSYVGLYYGYQPLEGHEFKFGKLPLVNYLLESRARSVDTPDLWKTNHYPFHAMKQGASLFCETLEGLQFGDQLGLVTYDESSRIETSINLPLLGVSVNIAGDPITDDYAAIDTIQTHKQAGHYASRTGIGYGVDKAIELLQTHGRYGSKPTILLMTDGNANEAPSGWSLPASWDWSKITDTDGDGSPDYTTSDVNKQYAFYHAKRAIDLGYTIHTMTVGADGDRSLMRAIAAAAKGEYVNVPGGATVAEIEAQCRAAFIRIASNVPSAKLLIERTP